MERCRGHAITRDRTFIARACELAARAVADAAPNPPVGAVIAGAKGTLGEGYHHRRGEAHAEVEALQAAAAAGADVRGATAFVSLEPCNHHGRTGPCTEALIAAGIARVVIGALDPNPLTAGGGVARLVEAGIAVDVINDPAAHTLIERFAFTIAALLPYVTLKMAMSLDGRIAPRPGEFAVSGPAARECVRDLRYEHDAVMVGAGTIRVDNARLTVRPHRTRRKPYVRVVVCETDSVPGSSRIFAAPPDVPADAYAPSIVLAPAGIRDRFKPLEGIADLVFVGDEHAHTLDLHAALRALRAHGVSTVLCEGGPTLAGRLLAGRLVQRVVWFVAPRFLQTAESIGVLAGADVTRASNGWQFDRVERVGEDIMLSARIDHV